MNMLLALKFILWILELLAEYFDLIMASFYIILLLFYGAANYHSVLSNLAVNPHLLISLLSNDPVHVSLAVLLNLLYIRLQELHVAIHLLLRLLGVRVDLHHAVHENSVVLNLLTFWRLCGPPWSLWGSRLVIEAVDLCCFRNGIHSLSVLLLGFLVIEIAEVLWRRILVQLQALGWTQRLDAYRVEDVVDWRTPCGSFSIFALGLHWVLVPEALFADVLNLVQQ